MGRELECQRCRRWEGCPGKDDFSFQEIRFCPLQVIWLLTNAETLRGGEWPAQDRWGDGGGSRQVRAEGYFVKPETVIGELGYRLARTGVQAELLVTQVEDGRTLATLSPGAREVLMYIKGWRRKSMGFKQWLREVYRHKTCEKGVFAAVV